MPSLRSPRQLRVNVTPSERLKRWIKKCATPPKHMVKRPLMMMLAEKVREANGYETPEVWLTDSGELHLGSVDGQCIGRIA